MLILLHLFENTDVFVDPSSIFTITIILASLFILLLKWFSRPLNTKKHLPPSPRGLPIIGNLHQVGSLPHRSLWLMAKSHGNLMLLHYGSVPVLVASSADTASEIMKTHDIAFANRPKSSIFKRLLYDGKDVATAPYGEYWRQTKSILLLQLLSNRMVKSFNIVRKEETALMLDKIKQAASAASPVNLSEMFATLSNNVICRITLRTTYDGQCGGRTFKELLGEFAELLGATDIGSYIHWLKWVNYVNGINARVDKVATEIDDFLDNIVEVHTACHKGGNEKSHCDRYENSKDMVDILLSMQKENVLGFHLDRVSIKALILDMFAAGTDTTYTVMEWTMTELIRHPEYMKKIQNELRDIGKGKPLIEEKDLEGMKYLKAVIKETLRLHPPIPLLVMRESSQDVNVRGYDIAAGTQIIVNAWAIGRDPHSWEREEEFWPDRFLNSAIDYRGQDFQLIPFGAGRRVCPGIQFAITVIELVLANLVYKFNWSICGGFGAEGVDMAETSGITAHRKYPLIVIPTLHVY